jgi:anthranilate/para-aminobenzoate synthase component II
VASVAHDGTGVFTGLPSPFRAVRYHSLAAVEVPACLRVTAWTDDAAEVVMGVAHRDLPLVGVQFHPESVLTEHGAAMITSFLAGHGDSVAS